MYAAVGMTSAMEITPRVVSHMCICWRIERYFRCFSSECIIISPVYSGQISVFAQVRA